MTNSDYAKLLRDYWIYMAEILDSSNSRNKQEQVVVKQ